MKFEGFLVFPTLNGSPFSTSGYKQIIGEQGEQKKKELTLVDE